MKDPLSEKSKVWMKQDLKDHLSKSFIISKIQDLIYQNLKDLYFWRSMILMIHNLQHQRPERWFERSMIWRSFYWRSMIWKIHDLHQPWSAPTMIWEMKTNWQSNMTRKTPEYKSDRFITIDSAKQFCPLTGQVANEVPDSPVWYL